MLSCVVYGCVNNTLMNNDPNVTYYYFPKKADLVDRWLQATGWNRNEIDLENARICSLHFDEQSYTTEYKVMDFMQCYTKVLKCDAVPTLYLPNTHVQIDICQVTENDSGMNKVIVYLPSEVQNYETEIVTKEELSDLQHIPEVQSKVETVHDQIKSTEKYMYISNEENNSEAQADDKENVNHDREHSNEHLEQECVRNDEKYCHIQTEEQLIDLKCSNENLKRQIKIDEEKLQKYESTLMEKLSKWKKQFSNYKRIWNQYLHIKQKLLTWKYQNSLLPKVFSNSQIKILSGKKKIYWSNDDMAVGYTIRHLSNRRCYSYLTKHMKIPLPAVSSIKRWANLKGRSEVKKRIKMKSYEGSDDS